MSFSLYDATVQTFHQILSSTEVVLAKGKEHYQKAGGNADEVLDVQLIEDMLPFRFQVISVAHHSLGALKGATSGEFGPPQVAQLDYSGLQGLIQESLRGLDEFSKDSVNGLEGRRVTFKMGGMEIPFNAEDFLLSFSLPNFYFHATTTYDILRMKGVQLGKRDFLGRLRIDR
ncbi:MAG: DUF1993 domain-containing protein [Gammaproteobacteria bacterium]|nr:DUF1993 domain-containing protein [Gammaproteobacteria bacterium]